MKIIYDHANMGSISASDKLYLLPKDLLFHLIMPKKLKKFQTKANKF
jgi:hypothetical protein